MATPGKPIEHYYELAKWNLGAAIALPLLDLVVVSLRMYARKKQGLRLMLDDWLTIPALLLVLGAGAAMITGIAKHAVGYLTPPTHHVSSRTELSTTNPEITITSQVEFAMYLLCIPALGLIKISVLSFYHRIFCPQKSGVAHWVIIGMMCIVGLWTIAFFFAHLLACKGHFSAYWGSTATLKAKCIKTFLKTYCLSITDFITDALVLIIPLPLLWKLKLRTARKIAVTLIFLLGAVAVAASAIRLAFVSNYYHNGFNPRSDEDLTITGLMYWQLVEVCLGLLAACLPTIRFFFKGFSLDSIISSVRSALSLHSIRSNRSRVYDDITHNPATGEAASTASDANIMGSKVKTEGSSEFPLERIGERRGDENV